MKKTLLLSIISILLGGIIIFMHYLRVNDSQEITSFVTNISETSASVVWVTDTKSIGSITISEEDNLGNIAIISGGDTYNDDRDQIQVESGEYVVDEDGLTSRYTHHVTIRNLEPETTYYLKERQGIFLRDLAIKSFTTTEIKNTVYTPNPFYGQVIQNGEIEIADAIVIAKKIDVEGNMSQDISSFISNGTYTLDLGNLKSKDLKDEYLKESEILQELSIWGIVESNGLLEEIRYSQTLIEPDKDQPADTINLSKANLIEITSQNQIQKFIEPVLAQDGDGIPLFCSNPQNFDHPDCGGGLDADGNERDILEQPTNIPTTPPATSTPNPQPGALYCNNPQNANLPECKALVEDPTDGPSNEPTHEQICQWYKDNYERKDIPTSCGGPGGQSTEEAEIVQEGELNQSQNNSSISEVEEIEEPQNKWLCTETECTLCITSETTNQTGETINQTKCNVCDPNDSENYAESDKQNCSECVVNDQTGICEKVKEPEDLFCPVPLELHQAVSTGFSLGMTEETILGLMNSGFYGNYGYNACTRGENKDNEFHVCCITENTVLLECKTNTHGFTFETNQEVDGINVEKSASGIGYCVRYDPIGLWPVAPEGKTPCQGNSRYIVDAYGYGGADVSPSKLRLPSTAKRPEFDSSRQAYQACSEACLLDDECTLCEQEHGKPTAGYFGYCYGGSKINIPVLRTRSEVLGLYDSINVQAQASETNETLNQSFDPSQKLSDGVYTITGDGILTKTYEVTGEQEIQFFYDDNGDGIKDPDEEYLSEEEASVIRINVTQELALYNYNIDLGWNLIGIPMVMRGEGTSNIEKASDLINGLNEQGANVTQIATYRSGKFLIYSNRKNLSDDEITFGDDFAILPDEGYFVKNYTGVSLQLRGQKIEGRINSKFEEGWNLEVIYDSSKDNIKGFEYLNILRDENTQANVLSKWDSGRYENLVIEDGVEFGNDFDLFKTSGYWIRVN